MNEPVPYILFMLGFIYAIIGVYCGHLLNTIEHKDSIVFVKACCVIETIIFIAIVFTAFITLIT